LLGFTNSATEDKIEEHAAAEVENSLQGIFPNMSKVEFENDIYTIYDGDTKIGYAFKASGIGYGGTIDIIVGLEDENTVKGITILSHNETPGLGSRIVEEPFTSQFSGASINEMQIDGITGSTISSTAVIEAVRETALEKIESLNN
jgi:electron transport complex protein RnfG